MRMLKTRTLLAYFYAAGIVGANSRWHSFFGR
jgi:hypothetical protein